MTRRWPVFGVCLLALAAPAPALGQPAPDSYPLLSPRAFISFSQQQFAAKDTFEVVFGSSTGAFRGGGAELVVARTVFVEFSVTRFEQTGERAFLHGGETFRLGIPLTASIRPIEVVGGYRLTAWRAVIPYGGIGVGSYRYEESSEFATGDEDVSESANGLVLTGGVEVRLARFIGVTADLHYSSVEGIIGGGGISREFGENDLGGTAARFRIIIGR